MAGQIKSVLWKLLFASAAVVFYSGFNILADARRQPEIPVASVTGTAADDKPSGEKPVYRCPKISFLVRAGCHEPKPVEAKTPADDGDKKSLPKKADDNRKPEPLLQ